MKHPSLTPSAWFHTSPILKLQTARFRTLSTLQGRDGCQTTRLVELYPQIGGLGGQKRKLNLKINENPFLEKN